MSKKEDKSSTKNKITTITTKHVAKMMEALELSGVNNDLLKNHIKRQAWLLKDDITELLLTK